MGYGARPFAAMLLKWYFPRDKQNRATKRGQNPVNSHEASAGPQCNWRCNARDSDIKSVIPERTDRKDLCKYYHNSLRKRGRQSEARPSIRYLCEASQRIPIEGASC